MVATSEWLTIICKSIVSFTYENELVNNKWNS